MKEFNKARKAADIYSLDLLRVYSDPEHFKTKRIYKLINILDGLPGDVILSIGCGASIMEIEIVKKLGRKVIGIDCSPVAILLAKKEAEAAIEQGFMEPDSLLLVWADIMRGFFLRAGLPLVICFDVIAAFTLEKKKEFLQKIWEGYVSPKGYMVCSVLSYKNDDIREQCQRSVKELGYEFTLHSETLMAYAEIINSLTPKPLCFDIHRIDEECLVIKAIKP